MTDPAYPFANHRRWFRAAAMPNGDVQFGVAGPLVFLCEQRGHCADRVKYLTQGEAEQLRDALDAALRAFALGAEMAVSEAPRPANLPYPFRDHSSLADNGFFDEREVA